MFASDYYPTLSRLHASTSSTGISVLWCYQSGHLNLFDVSYRKQWCILFGAVMRKCAETKSEENNYFSHSEGWRIWKKWPKTIIFGRYCMCEIICDVWQTNHSWNNIQINSVNILKCTKQVFFVFTFVEYCLQAGTFLQNDKPSFRNVHIHYLIYGLLRFPYSTFDNI